MNYPFEVMKHEAELSYNEYKSELVKVVKNYIDSVAPTSNLNGYAIVDKCEKYDLDIKFVLAQGQIESHFGTTGMAIKTNSVFNVGAYDKRMIEEINRMGGSGKFILMDDELGHMTGIMKSKLFAEDVKEFLEKA